MTRMTRRFEILCLLAALSGLAGFILAAAPDPQAGLRGWLVAAVGWAAVSLGCLLLLCARILLGLGLERGLGPALAAAGGTLPLAGLAFIPVLMAQASLYPWVQVPPDGAFRLFWLRPGFFAWRNAGYFLLWVGAAGWVLRKPGRPAAGAGLVLAVLAGSLASTDWLLSLDPSFRSSVFGLLFLGHAVLAGWALSAFATFLACDNADPRRPAAWIAAAILFWAYLSFCQYLVIWNGNEPDEIRWVLAREAAPWGGLGWAVSALEGLLPFLLLLPARCRGDRRAVGLAAVSVLTGGMLETAVLVLPSFGSGAVRSVWPALAAVVGLGGLWLLILARRMRRSNALPHDLPMRLDHG